MTAHTDKCMHDPDFENNCTCFPVEVKVQKIITTLINLKEECEIRVDRNSGVCEVCNRYRDHDPSCYILVLSVIARALESIDD